MRAGFTTPLRRTEELDADGISRDRRAAAVARGSLVRVRTGVYVPAAEWADLELESRIIVRARAWDAVAGVRPVFSHTTAAAIHGLPLISADERIHIVSDDPRRGATPGVSRRRSGPADPEVVEVGGLRCTSVDWTVGELARWSRPEVAVAAMDAALRRATRYETGAAYREDLADETVSRWLDLASRRPYRWARARRWLAFTDGRADRPGESVSRVRLHQLGFAPPELQVPVAGPDGRTWWIDFAFTDARAFGEFDGVGKYRDPALLGRRTIADVILAEKQREDWIRATTDRRFARWGFEHLSTVEAFGHRLAAFSILPSGRRREPALRIR